MLCTTFASSIMAEDIDTSITIISPTQDQFVEQGTITVVGSYLNATSVTVSVDNTNTVTANLIGQNWNSIIETSALTIGEHTITANATGNNSDASSSVTINVIEPADKKTTDITYYSSIDAEPIEAVLYVPESISSSETTEDKIPLVVHLHGGGGFGELDDTLVSELENRNWIGISPDGRHWGLAKQGCFPGAPSWAYVDSNDPNVGPGEQDILDAIIWAQENYNIDADRIYLTGFSMGGRGTYSIGLKNPDKFAAIAPMSGPMDMFDGYATRPEPAACKEGITGGIPGDSPLVDTMYRITSGRFLIENAYNLPIFIGHGLADPIALNIQDTPNALLQGWHITVDNTWADCSGAPSLGLCFGHTPTLTELAEEYPNAYQWGYHFAANVAHAQDASLLIGNSIDSGSVGTIDPNNPQHILGVMDFFAQHEREASPKSVFFKTYTDTHKKNHWIELTSSTPWTDTPAAIEAEKTTILNAINVNASRAANIGIDLDAAKLQAHLPITINLNKLENDVLDPALRMNEEEILNPSLTLTSSNISFNDDVTVMVQGKFLAEDQITISEEEIHINNIEVHSNTMIGIRIK